MANANPAILPDGVSQFHAVYETYPAPTITIFGPDSREGIGDQVK